MRGRVADAGTGAAFEYRADQEIGAPAEFAVCEGGSLDEWLMERYTAFNGARGREKFFRIWHPPWPQCRTEVTVNDDSLLQKSWRWFRDARLAGANFSPGLRGVWMGWPHTTTQAGE